MHHLASTLGVSIGPCAAACFANLRLSDWRIEAFETGLALEEAVIAGRVDAVLELDLRDLDMARDNSRLTSASLRGIPQVVVPAGFADGLSPDMLDGLGKQMAMKTSASRGPVRIVVPRETDEILVKSLRLWLSPHVARIETDLSIDDPRFADILVAELRRCVP